MKQTNTNHSFRSLRSTAVLVAATAALLSSGLAACSKPDAEPAPEPRDGVIRLSADVVAAPQSRAPITDGSTANTKVVILGMHFLKKDGTTAQTNFGGITALDGNRSSTGSISFTTAPTYDKVNNQNAYMVAYWPSKAADGASATVTAGQKVVWTTDGKTDILLSTLNPSTVYDAGRYSAPRTGTLDLYHALADLRVVCKAVPTTEASLTLVQQQWGEITGVSVTNTAQTITYTYATNTVSYTNVANFDLLGPSYDGPLAGLILQANTGSGVYAAGMISPLKGGRLDLVVRSQKFPSGVRIPVQLKNLQGQNCDFEAGKRYTVTLTFSANDKDIAVETTAIEPWAAGGTGSAGDSDEGLTSERIYAPSEGVLDMRFPGLVPGGTLTDGTNSPYTFALTSTRKSYNPYTIDDTSNDKDDLPAAMLEPVYYKFEVAKADETAAAWPSAWAACKAKAPVGAWRLPRQSELALMVLNKVELEKTPGFTAFNVAGTTKYWSGIENGGMYSMASHFGYGVIGINQFKSDENQIRCVRELDPPLPVVENYYYSDRTFSRELHPTKTPEGVVFWVDPNDPKHFKIVAMDQPPANWEGSGNSKGQLKWATKNVLVGKTNPYVGKTNTLEIMKQTDGQYPAAKWCYLKNKGVSVPAPASATVFDVDFKWYLPASHELAYLISSTWGIAPVSSSDLTNASKAAGYPDAWNAKFTTKFTMDHRYWSSTESNYQYAYYMYFHNGSEVSNYKTTLESYIRCIQDITLP